MLRRIATLLALVALVSAPSIARARLVCRFSGLEITDCGEAQAPEAPVAQDGGCCDQQLTRPLAPMLVHPHPEVAPPALPLLPTAAPLELSLPRLADRFEIAAAAAGPPLYLRTRALLI